MPKGIRAPQLACILQRTAGHEGSGVVGSVNWMASLMSESLMGMLGTVISSKLAADVDEEAEPEGATKPSTMLNQLQGHR